MKKIIILLLTVTITTILSADTNVPSDILEQVDEKLTFDGDFSCIFSMATYRVGEEPQIQQMSLFSRPEQVDGTEKFLAIVLKPDTDKGTGYLGQGDNYWIYDPESRRTSHSSARDSVQNSDVNNDDLGTAEFHSDYEIISTSQGMLGQIDCWILDLEAKNDAVDYHKVRLWVGKEQMLPYKEEDYSLSGTLMRTVLAPKWTIHGSTYIYQQVYFIDEIKKGNKTVLLFDQVSLSDLPDHLFTKAYLEGLSR